MNASLEQLFQSAQRLHQAGRLDEAEAVYRQVLARRPEEAGSLHALGLLAFQTRRAQLAVELLEKSLAGKRTPVEFFFNAAVVFEKLGNLARATELYQRAIELRPAYPEALSNLAAVFTCMGRFTEAMSLAQRALACRPGWQNAIFNLGQATKARAMQLHFSRSFTAAIELYQETLKLNPTDTLAQVNLAVALAETGQADEALGLATTLVGRHPELADAQWALGFVLESADCGDEAKKHYQRALEAVPALSGGVAFRAPEGAQLEIAMAWCRQSVGLNPSHLSILVLVAGVLARSPEFGDDAAGSFAELLAANPSIPSPAWALSSRLLSMHFDPPCADEALVDEHKRLGRLYERMPVLPSASIDGTPGRRVRVGYVSADFWTHSVAYFIEALLMHHDRERFEIFCYANNTIVDETTRRLASYPVAWRAVAGLADPSVAQQIRADGIDILVDLSGHTAGNRLGLFALKSAPVQVTMLGYPDTTGLARIDYRLTDAIADPLAKSDREELARASEHLVRLDRTAWCYCPPVQSPEVSPLPADRSGIVTFGCFNNIQKLTAQTAARWAQLVGAVPDSKLVLKSAGLDEPSIARRVREWLAPIPDERVELLGRVPTVEEHLMLYHRVDIALDTFPYNGTTTTCESLWMGVPVVTMAGTMHCARVGASLLKAVGLADLLASTPGEWIDIARKLAADRSRRAELRATLRSLMKRSPLLDAAGYTLAVETEFLKMRQRSRAG